MIHLGLYDTDGIDVDKNQKNEIIKIISKEKIKIKGILFLSNFQNERFDASEQDTLIQYNAIFPLKDFWKRIILIFTHYYGDPYKNENRNLSKKKYENLLNNDNVIFHSKINESIDIILNYNNINNYHLYQLHIFQN